MSNQENLAGKNNETNDSTHNPEATSRLLQPHLLTGYHSRGYLPHLKAEGATYWVTFRLADSLPQHVLRKLEEERKEFATRQQESSKIDPKELARQWKRLYSKRIQEYLDAGFGECWLRRDDIGGLVVAAIRHFEGSRYDLHPWVVMPNHAHVGLTPLDFWTLSSILHSWRSYTGVRANRILGRVGKPFWQREAYDHLVRNEKEFYRICEYTINNPVAAGLCQRPEEWKFSSVFEP
jgi:REP element-mobilizing transposase RayT